MRFTSRSGVDYWYDDAIGISYPLKTHQESPRKTNSSEQGMNDDDEDPIILARFREKLKKIQHPSDAGHRRIIGTDEVKKQLFRHGLLQMILCVTEECNLACRYCVYSDVYEHSRNPSQKKMDFKTARTALDYYVALIKTGRGYNPMRTPSIGFYGGEPLLNYELIRKSVHYLSETYPEIPFSFNVTTNGTLLDDEKIDFLIANNFSISISLDGPQEEHDRNRVYTGGKGTFEDVMKNVKKITDLGYEKCHSLAVFDIKSDIFKLQDFFNREDVPKLSNITMPNRSDGCTYYDQYSEEDFMVFREAEERAFEWYLKNIGNHNKIGSFFDHLFGIYGHKTIYMVPVLIERSSSWMPYTGACIPGRKIFVDVEGNYHVCERINQTFPIGSIHTGLDFETISRLVTDYTDHLDACQSCGVQRLCGKCYCAFALDGYFKAASRECNRVETNSERDLARAFTIGEISPDYLAMLADDYYSWLYRVSTTMGD